MASLRFCGGVDLIELVFVENFQQHLPITKLGFWSLIFLLSN
ncbi:MULTISPECIES: hypothetical protein [Prochlorococcus]|nr:MULTISPECIES: hypothetical protein [Prochlorococcus]KGG18742.1 hypothetical protein EV08_1991 [Prochlorococcus marinus str. SS2]KGG23016.1 hypothetical protein EV09_1759 [Prochlorococcus marinus str. SS35]KGG33723.1 hypothetical protein EV10_0158 [Prochlorococcus marinus str. SS51]KGG11303.1 hypothetical protein EV04_1381 [Prochlorococcus marinus str. LG]KGG36926.1 hypothetical protein EV11_0712 [Prochlorococcus sp. SS52]